MKIGLQSKYLFFLFSLALLSSCNQSDYKRMKMEVSEKAEEFKNNFDLAFENDWSTRKAIKIIEKSVLNYDKFHCKNFDGECNHKVFMTSDLRMDNKEYKILLVVSFNSESDEPDNKWDDISCFQFLKTDFGWLLDKSYLTFTATGTFGLNEENYNVFNIGLNKYALFNTGSYIGQGYLEDYITIYTIVDGRMKNVLNLQVGSDGEGAGDNDTNWESKVEILKEGSGFYDIKVIKKGKEFGYPVDAEIVYKFNGTEYVEF